jgi:hypothetical protein
MALAGGEFSFSGYRKKSPVIKNTPVIKTPAGKTSVRLLREKTDNDGKSPANIS